MIAEALKHIRIMKKQYQVYEHAEKVLEELSVVAETGAQVRRETADAQTRLAEVEETTRKAVQDAQETIDRLNETYTKEQAAKSTRDEIRHLELQNRLEAMAASVENYKLVLSRLDQEVDAAKRDHHQIMGGLVAEREKIASEIKRLKAMFGGG